METPTLTKKSKISEILNQLEYALVESEKSAKEYSSNIGAQHSYQLGFLESYIKNMITELKSL